MTRMRKLLVIGSIKGAVEPLTVRVPNSERAQRRRIEVTSS